MCVIFSTFTTPFFGIPIGVIAYFLFFYKDDDFDEMGEKYDYQDKNKKYNMHLYREKLLII